MNTGFIQVKYQLLKQWPIVSGDLASTKPLLKLNCNVDVERIGDRDVEDKMENIQIQKDTQATLLK